MKKIRIAKFLAQSGIASRRKAEEFVSDGLVAVNGKLVDDLSFKVDPDKDIVRLGKKVVRPSPKKYFILNKPKGYVTTKSDEKGRKTVLDLLPLKHRDLHPVGRLDKNSTGMLIMTNDGEFTNRITHPRYSVSKVYRVFLDKFPCREDMAKIRRGVFLDGKKTMPVEIVRVKKRGNKFYMDVKLCEGRNREVRRIFARFGYKVKALDRIRMGSVGIAGLRRGEYRVMTDKERESLLNGS